MHWCSRCVYPSSWIEDAMLTDSLPMERLSGSEERVLYAVALADFDERLPESTDVVQVHVSNSLQLSVPYRWLQLRFQPLSSPIHIDHLETWRVVCEHESGVSRPSPRLLWRTFWRKPVP